MFHSHHVTLETYNKLSLWLEETGPLDECDFFHDDYYRDGDKCFVEDALKLLRSCHEAASSGDPLVLIYVNDGDAQALIVVNKSIFEKFEIATKFPSA